MGRINTEGTIYVNGKEIGTGTFEFEYAKEDDQMVKQYRVEETPSLESRITELEAKVAELETQLAAKTDKDAQDFANALAYEMTHGNVRPAKQTPNARRAAVIKQAREFVADLEQEIDGQSGWLTTSIPEYKRCGRLRVEYVINPKKRTVVALTRLGNVSTDTVYAKGIAKCAPDDVFNADIGKAIALARALGIKVPAEFLNAPKPETVVVGMRVRGKSTSGYYRQSRTFTLTNPRKGGWAYSEDYPHSKYDWITKSDIGAIIDDTDAQYEVSS